MKNALISPNEQVEKVIDWKKVGQFYVPVMEVIADSERIAEVADIPFEVAPPLFWIECADDVHATDFYYDSVQQAILLIPPPPPQPA